MILYSIYKNLGSKFEPEWSETPLHEGLSETNTIHDLITELGGNSGSFDYFLVNYKVSQNEATTVISDSQFVIDALEVNQAIETCYY